MVDEQRLACATPPRHPSATILCSTDRTTFVSVKSLMRNSGSRKSTPPSRCPPGSQPEESLTNPSPAYPFRRSFANSTRIAQFTRKYRKRGGILEQQSRPTAKFQSHFGLSHVVAMRLSILSKHC